MAPPTRRARRPRPYEGSRQSRCSTIPVGRGDRCVQDGLPNLSRINVQSIPDKSGQAGNYSKTPVGWVERYGKKYQVPPLRWHKTVWLDTLQIERNPTLDNLLSLIAIGFEFFNPTHSTDSGNNPYHPRFRQQGHRQT